MVSPAPTDEKDLLLRLQLVDYRAFENVCSNHKEKIANRLLRLLKSYDLAENILRQPYPQAHEINLPRMKMK